MEEYDLQTVCRTMLDNADMDVEFTNAPFAVRLTFYVVGMDKKVIFDCAEIASFHLDKDPDDRPFYVVLGVRIAEPSKLRPPDIPDHEFSLMEQSDFCWHIEIEPEANVKIAARRFEWRVDTMSAEELSWFQRSESPM